MRLDNHPFANLTRENLSSHVVRTLHAGRGTQASVYLVEVNGCRAVVKDLAGRGWFRRLVAPWLVRREARVLQFLQGCLGVPRYYKMLDARAFVLEYIEGRAISDLEPERLNTELFAQLQRIVDEIHARGVSHGDLKRRQNVLVTGDGRVVIIDYAASLIRRRFAFTNWLQREMALIDNKAMPRIKNTSAPQLMTPSDLQTLSRPTRLEKFARRWLKR